LSIVEKNVSLAKQPQVRAVTKRGERINVTQKIHEKNEMLPVTFVGNLYKTHAVLCSKIADVHGTEVHDIRIRKFVYFRKIFRFLSYTVHRDCLTKMAKFVCKNTCQSVEIYQSQTV